MLEFEVGHESQAPCDPDDPESHDLFKSTFFFASGVSLNIQDNIGNVSEVRRKMKMSPKFSVADYVLSCPTACRLNQVFPEVVG